MAICKECIHHNICNDLVFGGGTENSNAIGCKHFRSTADVVPRAEVDLYRRQVDELEDELASTYDKLENAEAEVERLEGELIVERTRRKNAVNAYHSAKAEVASVIFAEIESICLTHVDRYNRYLIYSEDFAELKKKYTEGGDQA